MNMKYTKYKLAATMFTAMVILISTYAVLRPSYDLGLFVDLDRGYAKIRILLALGILAYVLIPVLRLKISQLVMLAGGSLLLMLGISSIFSPLLFGHLSHYIALGDIIMAIEAGVVSMLGGLQLKTKNLHLSKYFMQTVSFYQDRLSSLRASSSRPSQSRTA